MAQQTVTLNPGESKIISFEATPAEARTYQVSVDGLTSSFVAKAAAKFVYVSDIRWGKLAPPSWGYSIEVDIKNSGGVAGTCHPVATLDFVVTYAGETWVGGATADMGTKTINPGETATFSGAWIYATGPTEPPYLYTLRDIVIQSEAGIISLALGKAQIAIDIPAQINQGAPVWVTTKIYLQYDPYRVYGVSVVLRSKEKVDVDEYIRMFIDSSWTKELPYPVTVTSLPICSASIGPPGYTACQLTLDTSRIYEIKGVWEGRIAGGNPVAQSPGFAVFDLARLGIYKEPLFGSGLYGLPMGFYDVMLTWGYDTWTGRGNETTSGPFQELKIGEVLIMPAVSGLMNLQPGYAFVGSYAAGAIINASVDFVNSGNIPVTLEVHCWNEGAQEYIQVITFPPGRKTVNYTFTIPPMWEGEEMYQWPLSPDFTDKVSYGFWIRGFERVLWSQTAMIYLK